MRAYIARIDALNKRGPGLNAVTQLNAHALKDAAKLDAERAAGTVRGPAHGLPVLLKDLIDVVGHVHLQRQLVAAQLVPAERLRRREEAARRSGVVILGKLGLSEYANSFGNQPSGFANLTGQVVHGLDADQNPSGSSSGSGTAGAAALSMLDRRHRDVGLDHQPVGRAEPRRHPADRRPRPGVRHRRRSPRRRTRPGRWTAASPTRRCTCSRWPATTRSATRRTPSSSGRTSTPSCRRCRIRSPTTCRRSTSDFVDGKRIGYNGTFADGSPSKIAFDALEAAGAIMVERPQIAVGPVPGLPAGYQQHKSINEYYKGLGPFAPIKTLLEEIADNQANEHEALKFGNNSHLNASLSDVSPGQRGRDRVPRGDADPPRGAAPGDQQHDEQRDAGRSERRLHRDPRHACPAARRPARRRSRSRWATATRTAAR